MLSILAAIYLPFFYQELSKQELLISSISSLYFSNKCLLSVYAHIIFQRCIFTAQDQRGFLQKGHLLSLVLSFGIMQVLQKVCPQGNIRIGELFGGTINSQHIGQNKLKKKEEDTSIYSKILRKKIFHQKNIVCINYQLVFLYQTNKKKYKICIQKKIVLLLIFFRFILQIIQLHLYSLLFHSIINMLNLQLF
ncbi:transmembrane protein, putative (macronuclear) [Tetrahymena thermophila SB210]|uniref:Transmembrane protein, putative n=1 Tax=Tetrahymena thermophila (strain SB210) TaxID=312017 RepID=W7WYZ5_TETTS|nr:transmembrane protein, putative [Tetrahymena thermophila SB210]EWS72135.1 transmembrane protein, putative [Tetrahymena thermophila SB210]|eukprot:XP_012655328.1 transmembrane protein, putative [Tetrahymena thermophila SB210]